MEEFRLPRRAFPTPSHDSRIMLWVSIAALVLSFSILIFIGYAPHSVVHRFGQPLVGVLVLIILCTLGTYIVMLRRKVERLRHDLTFVLGQDELVRKMPRHPDVRIPLPKVKTLHEQAGCLVVEGSDPPRRIAVPRKVENFELLKAELLKYAPLSPPPLSYRLGWATSCLYILSGVLLTWSGNVTIIRTAAAVFVILSGWESFKLHHLLRRSPKRFALWLAMGSFWLSIGFLIYIRVFGGNL